MAGEKPRLHPGQPREVTEYCGRWRFSVEPLIKFPLETLTLV